MSDPFDRRYEFRCSYDAETPRKGDRLGRRRRTIEGCPHRLLNLVHLSSFTTTMQSQSRIAELAALVASHTACVDQYISDNGLSHPSFNADSPVNLGLPPDIEKSRIAVLEASQELNDLLQGPRDLLFNHQVCLFTMMASWN